MLCNMYCLFMHNDEFVLVSLYSSLFSYVFGIMALVKSNGHYFLSKYLFRSSYKNWDLYFLELVELSYKFIRALYLICEEKKLTTSLVSCMAAYNFNFAFISESAALLI